MTQQGSINRLLDGLAQLRAVKASRRPEAKAATVDITVAVMSYNNSAYLAQTIESVLAQQGVRFELRVFDDCSSDASLEVLERYTRDPRFHYQSNARNLGMIGNYNQCLRAGSGRYVVVLGSDDVIYPDHLLSLFEVLEHNPHVALAYSQCLWIDEQGKTLRHAVHPGHRAASYVGGRDELVDLLCFDNYITPSAVMLRRSILPALELPDGGIHRAGLLAGDWELWTRVAQVAPEFAFIAQPSVGYRIHGEQISNRFYGTDRPLAEHTEILELNLAVAAARVRMHTGAADIWALYAKRMASYPADVQACFESRQARIREQLFASTMQGRDSDEVQFSIILTTYNRPDLLKDALASVGRQTLRDFEVVLVNDNGEPVESLLAACDFPVTYVRQGRNRGLSAARNAGLKLARGTYVCYLDDDDFYLPDHLATLARTFASHPNTVVYTGVEYVDERLEAGRRIELARSRPFLHQEHDRERLFIQNYIPVNTWAHPRSMLATVGEFDTGLTAFEDWDMLLRLGARYGFVHAPEVTTEVRVRQGSTAGSDHMLGRERKNFGALYQEMYRRHADLGSERVRTGRRKLLRQFGIGSGHPRQVLTLETWLSQRTLTPLQKTLIDDHLNGQSKLLRICVVILDHDGEAEKVVATYESLRTGFYQHTQPLLLSPVDYRELPADLPIYRAGVHDWPQVLNALLAQSDFDWLCIVKAGERFTPAGLLMATLELLGAPDCRAVYGDELYQPASGGLGSLLRPALNLDYLLSFPAGMARHWLLRRDVVVQAGGFDAQFLDASEFELILRLINQQGLAGLGHVAEPLLVGQAPLLLDREHEKRAISQHLALRGYEQAEVFSSHPGRYRIRYGHVDAPLVSILIEAGERLAPLQRCVESLLETTTYPHYEVLMIEDNANALDVSAWLAALDGLGESRIRVVRDHAQGSPSERLNAAARLASGSLLLLLDAEAAAFEPEWLDELVNHAQRPEVGVVGGLLLSAAGKVTQAALVLGLEGPVGEPFIGQPASAAGYMHRLEVTQNCSAVSRRMLMIKASLFQALDGMTEGDLAARYLDVDLCLRAQQAGYLTVWTPFARMLAERVDQSSPSIAEQDGLYVRWLPLLARDPAYNPSLSLAQPGGFKLADTAMSWRPLASFKPLPVVLAHPADQFGCGHYRVMQPFHAQQQAGLIDGVLSVGLMHVADLERYAPDVVLLQRQIGDERIDAMRRMKAFSPAFKVYELDDYLPNLPMKNAHRKHMPKDILRSLRRGLAHVDRFVVSTEPLAEAFAGLHLDIRVMQNRLPVTWWKDLQSQRRVGPRPRVGWAGGVSHTGDLELIADVVRELANEVDWIFLGMCPERIRPYVKEMHAGVEISRYPAMLASLNLDLAIAPVEDNLFNACKSNLRLLEYGACGFPVICSDVRCYQDGLPVTRVKNRFRDWVDSIRMHLNDLDACAQAGDTLRSAVLSEWMLEGDNLRAWRTAWLPD